jgi:hypothetical protein
MRLNPAGSSGAWGYLTNGVNTDLPGNYVLKFNNLKSVTFSNTYVPSWYRTLSGITLGDTLTALDDNCFQWLSNWVPVGPNDELSTFVVPANIERMSMTRTFRNCRKIKRIVFENAKNIKETSSTDIGMFATFMQCYGLTAIDGLSDLTACTALSAYSFAYTQVTRLDLRNIVQLGNSSMTSANEPFLNCTNLQDIVLDYNNMDSDAFSISKFLFASTKAKNGTFNIRILNCPEGYASEFLVWARGKLQGIAALKNKATVRLYGTTDNKFTDWD